MAVTDLFSKRQKRARGEMPDVYTYDDLPQALRVQVIQIITEASPPQNTQLYSKIRDVLCRERGVFSLPGYLVPKRMYIVSPSQVESRRQNEIDARDEIRHYFLQESSIENALDIVELVFSEVFQHNQASPLIEELNIRFKEHGVGYQFEGGQIIRIDSEFIHAEAVKPALALLREPGFEGANEEFMKAYEHYRHGRHKECLVECAKAFESVMKTICGQRGWAFQANDTAKKLIDVCFQNQLIPPYLQSQFSSLQSLLESGIATVRNKAGAHGQGTAPTNVPDYMAQYALNMTATTLLFLLKAYGWADNTTETASRIITESSSTL